METWENQRLNCIGASEIGSLFSCGFNNIIDLWKFKTGLKKKKSINQELSNIGHNYEKIIIDYVKEQFNLDFVHNAENNHFLHKDYNFIGCTPDAFNDEAILQCKTYRLIKGKKRWSESKIPFNYVLQTLQEMVVMDKNIGYLAVQYFKWRGEFVEDGIEIFSFNKEDYLDTVENMIERSVLFWDYVKNKEVPNINKFKKND